MQNKFYCYILYRADGTPFYVGKGQGYRWLRHERKRVSRDGNLHKHRIVDQLLAELGYVPKKKVAEGLTEEEAFALERRLIAEIGRVPNGPLVNLTDGGDGCTGAVWSAESRAKVSLWFKGKRKTAEQRARMSESLKGRKCAFLLDRNSSPEMRAMVVEANKRRGSVRRMIDAMTPEQLSERARKVQASISPERRREIARKRAAAKTPEEHSERIRRANASQTPEQRRARQLKAAETRRRNRENARTQDG